MATQTGECSIESIAREGDVVVRGHFRSLAALDVGFGDRDWAADFLCEALRKRAGVELDRQALWQGIGAVMFATPRHDPVRFLPGSHDAPSLTQPSHRVHEPGVDPRFATRRTDVLA